jgi:hypothetical protein
LSSRWLERADPLRELPLIAWSPDAPDFAAVFFFDFFASVVAPDMASPEPVVPGVAAVLELGLPVPVVLGCAIAGSDAATSTAKATLPRSFFIGGPFLSVGRPQGARGLDPR